MKAHRLFAFAFVALVAACGSPGPQPLAATRVETQAYDPASGEPYFAAPWPDDRRLSAAGTLTTLDFPNPENGTLFSTTLQTANGLVHGWGLSSPIYLPFTGAIDPNSLPASPAASLTGSASLFLAAIDPSSRFYGRRVPLEWDFIDPPTLWLPGHVLAARPVRGFPLEPKTRYALVVTTAVKDKSGAAVGPEASFRDALQGKGSAAAWWKPLVAFLGKQEIPVDQVAGATIFTTQPILDEMLAMRDYVESLPRPQVENLKFIRTSNGFSLFEGTYPAPNFMHGTPPYEFSGGQFEWDQHGQPIPAVTEDMRVAVCVPDSAMPPRGYPVVFYSHGTGGDFETAADDGTCELLAAKGIATFGIDQVLHGTRAPAGATCFGQTVDVCFFNIVNAPAGRNLMRQSAIDHVSLRRLAEGLEIPPSIDPGGRDITFDHALLGFRGHSQGGLTGALYAAIARHLDAAMLSGAGGHLTTTILERTGDVNLKALLESSLFLDIAGKESLDQFHPALALMQTLADVADPISYARYWFEEPVGERRSVLMMSGTADQDTPIETHEALAIAGGLPQLDNGCERAIPAFALAGLLPAAPPLTGNIPKSGDLPAVTAAIREFPGQDHFVSFNDPSAVAQIGAYFQSLFANGIPTIDAADAAPCH